MASATTGPARKARKLPWTRLWKIGIVLLLASAAGILILIHSPWWPLAREPITRDLEAASDSQVQIERFHRTYFPHPGCVIEGVRLRHGPPDAKPLVTIDKLVIRSGYFTILSHRLSLVQAEGLKIFIPPFGTGQPFHTQDSRVTVDKIVANNAAIEFASRNPAKSPLRFEIHNARLEHVGASRSMSYTVALHNPNPPGEVAAGGKFGPWVRGDAQQTPVSGQYRLEHLDLAIYRGIGGLLSSAGSFAGKLGHIDIWGTTDTPDFEVKSGGRPVHLQTEFSVWVDATRGETYLKQVNAQFGKTHVVADGSVAREEKGPANRALIHLTTEKGRIEDILGLFTQEQPPMSGSVTLEANAEIPPGQEPFLQKVKFRGRFGIGPGEFTKPTTQQDVNQLSAGARGEKKKEDPQTVLTDLKGQVVLAHTVANFSDLSFAVPGAAARLHGTYNVVNYGIDLHGQMHVDTKISKTASGPKALLLKIMDPLFKKRKKGEVLPVKITGTYDKPAWGLDVTNQKDQASQSTRR
jgi:AsmA-like C-terminal region